MIKKFLTGIFTAMAVSGMFSVSASAESGKSIEISDSGRITLTAENTSSVTAMKVSLRVEPESEADISFMFSDNNLQIAEYRYHPETNILNIYISDTEAIFEDDKCEIGSVSARDSDGNSVPFSVTAEEDFMEYVSNYALEKNRSPENFSASVTSSGKVVGIDTGNQFSNINLKKVIPSSYTVVIPDSEINIDVQSEMSVSANNVMIANNEILDISVKSENNWLLHDQKSGSTATLAYSLTPSGGTALTGAEPVSLISVNAGELSDRSVERTLTAEVTGIPEVSGIYKDILTFKVSVNEKQ